MSANDRQVGGEHYKDSGFQHWDFAIAAELNYLEGCITKYVTRWRKKNGLQDLEKAAHFLEKLLETAGLWDTVHRTTRPMATPVGKLAFDYYVEKNGLGKEEADVIWRVVTWTRPVHLRAAMRCMETLLQTARNHVFAREAWADTLAADTVEEAYDGEGRAG